MYCCMPYHKYLRPVCDRSLISKVLTNPVQIIAPRPFDEKRESVHQQTHLNHLTIVAAPNVVQNHIMMLSILPLSYTFLRYLYLVLVKGLGGSPDKLVYQDKPLLISLIIWAMIVTSVLYI